MSKRIVVVLVAVLLGWALVGCSGSSSDAGGDEGATTSAATDDGGQDDGADAGDDGTIGSAEGCGDAAGAEGVVRGFCDGPAVVEFEIDGVAGSIEGGECEESGGYFVVNAGTVVDTSYTGDLPDYAGLLLPLDAGDFTGTDATLTINHDGEAVVLTQATGSHDGSSGTFEGTDVSTGTAVSGSFTC